MPIHRQVEVEVLGERGYALSEYGETRNARMKMVSCFIRSETDKRFRIRITPEDDLLRYDEPDSDSWFDDKDEEFDRFGRSRSLRKTPSTPWHLLATLKLDGRPEIERRVFVLLDRNDEFFEHLVVLRGAMVRDEDGVWKEYEWVFKDVGIDVAFDNLALGDIHQGTVPAQEEDDLADSLGAMRGPNSAGKCEKGKVGQIQVRLDRVTLGKTVQGISGTLKDATDLSRLDGSTIGDAQHTVGRARGARKTPPSQTTYYHHMDPDHEPYAIFRFNYCEEKKLRKMGFLDALSVPQLTNRRSEALKMAAAVQKKLKPAIAYKFRNLETGETDDDGHDGDDEQSEDGEDASDEDEGEGPSEDLPLDDLEKTLGELGMDRTRKRDDETSEEREKKAKAE